MKVVYYLKKKVFAVICVSLLLLSGVFVSSVLASNANTKKLPIYGVNTDEKKIALTLDCAWENSDTKELLSIFEENKIKATFFTTGDFCNRYPQDVKLMYESGHAIENHSYGHPHVASISKEKLIEDTKKCDAIITELTGKKPSLYRAPYGEYSNKMLDTFETDLFHRIIQWDVDSRDWQGRSADEMINSVKKNIRNGSIILFHNDTKNTSEALKKLIPELIDNGYEFVLVSELIYNENFKLDHEGRQVKIP